MGLTVEARWRCDAPGCTAERTFYWPNDEEKNFPPDQWDMVTDWDGTKHVRCPEHNPYSTQNLTSHSRAELWAMMLDEEAKQDMVRGYDNVLFDTPERPPMPDGRPDKRHDRACGRYARLLATEIKGSRDIYASWSVVQDHLEEMKGESGYGFLTLLAEKIQRQLDKLIGAEAVAARPEVPCE